MVSIRTQGRLPLEQRVSQYQIQHWDASTRNWQYETGGDGEIMVRSCWVEMHCYHQDFCQ